MGYRVRAGPARGRSGRRRRGAGTAAPDRRRSRRRGRPSSRRRRRSRRRAGRRRAPGARARALVRGAATAAGAEWPVVDVWQRARVAHAAHDVGLRPRRGRFGLGLGRRRHVELLGQPLPRVGGRARAAAAAAAVVTSNSSGSRCRAGRGAGAADSVPAAVVTSNSSGSRCRAAAAAAAVGRPPTASAGASAGAAKPWNRWSTTSSVESLSSRAVDVCEQLEDLGAAEHVRVGRARGSGRIRVDDGARSRRSRRSRFDRAIERRLASDSRDAAQRRHGPK